MYSLVYSFLLLLHHNFLSNFTIQLFIKLYIHLLLYSLHLLYFNCCFSPLLHFPCLFSMILPESIWFSTGLSFLHPLSTSYLFPCFLSFSPSSFFSVPIQYIPRMGQNSPLPPLSSTWDWCSFQIFQERLNPDTGLSRQLAVNLRPG